MSRLHNFGLGLGIGAGVILFMSPEARDKARQLLMEAAARALDTTEEYRGRLRVAIDEGRKAAEEIEQELKERLGREDLQEEAPRFIV